MAKENVERIFSGEFLTDSKHKLNTTNKAIPESMLENIERNGITLEQLNELSDKGFDIFKYHTQITLHGICKELSSERINGYKLLTLNKNKSIGIRWAAIDNAKKKEIINKLSYFGWSSNRNSAEYYPRLVKTAKTRDEAVKIANELEKIAERIDETLFYGSYAVNICPSFCRFFIELNLFINGIPENNIDKLISQVVGKDITEINTYIVEQKAIEDAYWTELHKKYEVDAEKTKADKEQKKKEITDKMIAEGYHIVKSNELSKGTIFVYSYFNRSSEYVCQYWIMQGRFAKRCDANGTIDNTQKGDSFFKNYGRNVWVK